MLEWVKEFFRNADALDADGVATLLTDTVTVKFGNAEVVTGRENVRSTFADFYNSLAGMQHNIINLWEIPGGAVAESLVTYTRSEGGQVEIPAVTILDQDDGGISSIRIYIDMSPLYA